MSNQPIQKTERKFKVIEHYEKFLDIWKDADPGIPLGIPEVSTLIEDAKKRLAMLKE